MTSIFIWRPLRRVPVDEKLVILAESRRILSAPVLAKTGRSVSDEDCAAKVRDFRSMRCGFGTRPKSLSVYDMRPVPIMQ